MEPQARGAEDTPLLRVRSDNQGWFPGVALFTTRRDEASGATRGARAVLALAAAATLCVGAAFTTSTKGVFSSLGLSSSAADVISPSVGDPGVSELGGGLPYKRSENIVKFPQPLPDVDFSDKTLLIVMGHPFSGTSALEGLIGTGEGVTSLCSSGTWQCEDTYLLESMGFGFNPEKDMWNEDFPVGAEGFAYAFQHFALTWWDMSKPLLMDKTPNLLGHHRAVADAADLLGVKVKFVLLTRHTFSWHSEDHPFNQDLWKFMMKYTLRALDDPRINLLQIKYEDLAWNLDETIESLNEFLPRLGKLDPWSSGLKDPEDPKAKEKSGERSKGIAQYFEHHPLKWEQRPLDDEAFKMLCEAGYKGNGECEH